MHKSIALEPPAHELYEEGGEVCGCPLAGVLLVEVVVAGADRTEGGLSLNFLLLRVEVEEVVICALRASFSSIRRAT